MPFSLPVPGVAVGGLALICAAHATSFFYWYLSKQKAGRNGVAKLRQSLRQQLLQAETAAHQELTESLKRLRTSAMEAAAKRAEARRRAKLADQRMAASSGKSMLSPSVAFRQASFGTDMLIQGTEDAMFASLFSPSASNTAAAAAAQAPPVLEAQQQPQSSSSPIPNVASSEAITAQQSISKIDIEVASPNSKAGLSSPHRSVANPLSLAASSSLFTHAVTTIVSGEKMKHSLEKERRLKRRQERFAALSPEALAAKLERHAARRAAKQALTEDERRERQRVKKALRLAAKQAKQTLRTMGDVSDAAMSTTDASENDAEAVL